MDNGVMKDGWQRFVDRLKELWGKRPDPERGDGRSVASPKILEPLKAPDNASATVRAAEPVNAWENDGGTPVG